MLAVLVAAVVGFTMIYSRDSGFRYGVAAFLSGTGGAVTRAVSDLTGNGQAEGPVVANTTLRVVRPSQASWIGLSGFPDEIAVRFPVPYVGGYNSGALELHFDSQLAQGGDGLLTISVNDDRRAQIVLDTGHNTYDVNIPLTLSDMLADTVVLQLSARGTTNSGQICSVDAANSGSAISLLPASAMVLSAMREINDPQTSLMALPDPLLLYLGTTEVAQVLAIGAAQRLARDGVPFTLVEDAALPGRIIVTDNGGEPVQIDTMGNVILNGEAGLQRAIAFRRADAVAPQTIADWPVGVAKLTADTVAQNFRGTTRWTIAYDIADLPGGLMPTQLELALRTSLLADDLDWIVRVSLNGNMVQTARLPGNVADIRIPIDLPIDLQGLSNALVVELIDTSPNQNICGAAPAAQAQLLAESSLSAPGAQPVDGWGAMVRRLATASAVAPGRQGTIDASQATRLAAMLAQFLPAQLNYVLEPDPTALTLTMVDKDSLAELLLSTGVAGAAKGTQSWLITATGGTAKDPLGLNDLATLDQSALLNRMSPTSLAILVQTPPSQ